MDTLQIRAANMLCRDQTGRMLDDPYRAVDYVSALPANFYPRIAWFQLVSVPVNAKTYKYLLQWLDATPPRLLDMQDFMPHLIEDSLLEALLVGKIVGYQPVWIEDCWVLEAVIREKN